MNTEYFKYLQTLARSRSIHQAAEQLHIKQSNLSTILKNIEIYYGITIFERNNKGITLTRDGEFFMEQVQQILHLLQIMENPYQYPSKKDYSQVVQDIHIYIQDIASSNNFIMITNEFHKYFPYVNIQLDTKGQKEIFPLIQTDSVAIGLLHTARPDPFLNDLAQKQLHAIPFLSSHPVAFTSKQNHKAQRLDAISIYDFLQQDLVFYSSGELSENVLYQILCSYGQPNITYTVNNSTFFTELLQKGNYWSLGKITTTQKDQLLALPFEENLSIYSYFVCNQEAADSFIIQSFLKIATNLMDTLDGSAISTF